MRKSGREGKRKRPDGVLTHLEHKGRVVSELVELVDGHLECGNAAVGQPQLEQNGRLERPLQAAVEAEGC